MIRVLIYRRIWRMISSIGVLHLSGAAQARKPTTRSVTCRSVDLPPRRWRTRSSIYARAAIGAMGLGTVLPGVSFPGLAVVAVASPSASLAISATSGPVGSVIRVTGRYSSASFCEGVEFREVGANQNGHVELFPAQAANGSFTARLVVPSYLGASGSGTGIVPVRPGSYQVALVPGVRCASTSPPPPLTFQVTSAAVASSRFMAIAPTPDGKGYWLAQAGGGVYSFGSAGFFGSVPGLGIAPAAPIVGMAATADGRGYWLVGADGGVYAFGDARYYGSLPGAGVAPAAPIVGMAATADGRGYWLVGADGGVYAFGDASFAGSAISPPGVAVPFAAIARPDRAAGYYAEAVTGTVAQFGTTANSAQGVESDAFFSGLAITPDGQGIWQVGTDGGVFAFGDARFYGSLPGAGVTPNAPIVGIASTPDARGYWLLGADGGVFAFGDAGFFGSGTA